MATVAQRLEEARTARHNLITGKLARVFMDQNGERVEFNKTTINDLDLYIRELEASLDPSLGRRRQPRPIGFTF
jgi:hypothetical protein